MPRGECAQADRAATLAGAVMRFLMRGGLRSIIHGGGDFDPLLIWQFRRVLVGILWIFFWPKFCINRTRTARTSLWMPKHQSCRGVCMCVCVMLVCGVSPVTTSPLSRHGPVEMLRSGRVGEHSALRKAASAAAVTYLPLARRPPPRRARRRARSLALAHVDEDRRHRAPRRRRPRRRRLARRAVGPAVDPRPRLPSRPPRRHRRRSSIAPSPPVRCPPAVSRLL